MMVISLFWTAMTMFQHKLPTMVDVLNRRCVVGGCPTRPCYGYEGEKAVRCAKHKLNGMVNDANKRCEVWGRRIPSRLLPHPSACLPAGTGWLISVCVVMACGSSVPRSQAAARSRRGAMRAGGLCIAWTTVYRIW